ncbi:hypothetical protein [Aminiphilus circumscriptus]|uniref:hypothetical protein n=1 Tax=Aminiphilus circumscriptus TaxID=290732 RepID=UPI000492D4A8|nr:hypothetical protein [Aminiphilus circumscriptus]
MRFAVLLFSLGSIVGYAKAVAGLGGYFFGKGRPDLIILGILCGTLSAGIALLLWKRYLVDAGTAENPPKER